MRKIVLTFTFAVACGFAVLTVPAANAAMLTFGPQNQPFGGFGCADVSGGSIKPGTPIVAYDCHGASNQQFEFINGTITAFAGQRCLDALFGGTVPGTKIDSATCNGTKAQAWKYFLGQIVNLAGSGLCLDSGNGNNGTQLILNSCDFGQITSQQWQIK